RGVALGIQCGNDRAGLVLHLLLLLTTEGSRTGRRTRVQMMKSSVCSVCSVVTIIRLLFGASSAHSLPHVFDGTLCRDPFLLQRVAVPDRDGAGAHALAVHGDGERSPGFVEAAIALADGAAVIEERVDAG